MFLIFFLLSCTPSEMQYDFRHPKSSSDSISGFDDTGYETDLSYYFELVEQEHIQGSSIWNGLAAFDEQEFFFSTMVVKDLTLRKLSTEDLTPTSEVITIATLDDIDEDDHITDHALLRINNTVLFSSFHRSCSNNVKIYGMEFKEDKRSKA